jgi:hypothetical protein
LHSCVRLWKNANKVFSGIKKDQMFRNKSITILRLNYNTVEKGTGIIYKTCSVNFIRALLDDSNVNLTHIKSLRDQLVYCGINDYPHLRKFASDAHKDTSHTLKNLNTFITPGSYIRTIFISKTDPLHYNESKKLLSIAFTLRDCTSHIKPPYPLPYPTLPPSLTPLQDTHKKTLKTSPNPSKSANSTKRGPNDCEKHNWAHLQGQVDLLAEEALRIGTTGILTKDYLERFCC